MLIIAVFWLVNPIIILMLKQGKFVSSKAKFISKSGDVYFQWPQYSR